MMRLADHLCYNAAQEGQGVLLMGETSHATTNDQPDQILFKPGVLEALSGAVAARLAAASANTGDVFNFSAKKKPMQVKPKSKGEKKKKEGGIERAEDARSKLLGEKGRNPFEVAPAGSDIEFSFEKTMDSYERVLYGDMYASSKRVCTGRVETVTDGDGVTTHVTKETEGKEEAYVQQRRESVGDDGASAASEEEVRWAK